MDNTTKSNLLDLGADLIKLLDPTGITSWGDAADAIEHVDSNPETWLNAGVEVIGALPIIGKVGKLSKLSKLVRKVESLDKTRKSKPVISVLKVPGKVIVKSASALTGKDLTNTANTARNAVKLTKVGSSADDVVLGGEVKKGAASRVAHNSGGMASIISGPLSFFPVNAKYNGWIKANDTTYTAVKDKPDVINLMLYGDSEGFIPYDKGLTLNSAPLENTYKARLYPKNHITADKSLKGSIKLANATNFFSTNITEPIIDSHKFRLAFKPKFVRASDEFDFNPYTLSGRLMRAAARPTWKYPRAGFPTFVQEIPVTYSTKSDVILKTALEDE